MKFEQRQGDAMHHKRLPLFGIIALAFALVGFAEPALRQPRTISAKTPSLQSSHDAAAAKRYQRPNRTPADLPNTEKTSAANAKKQNSPEVPNTRLANKIKRVLDWYYSHPLNTRDDTPWSVLHWSIAYGVDAQVCVGGPDGRKVTAIGWLCCNRPAAGKRLVSLNSGNMNLPIAPGIQGHHGQFLSMLAQSKVPSDYVLRIGKRELEVANLVKYEKARCRSGMELTFKLIGISHYTPSNETWNNSRGESWSVNRLLREELKEPIDRMAACCGGTHRLYSLSYAIDRRRKQGLPIADDWKKAERRVQSYQRRAFQLQNSNGSFSTMWFERRENSNDKTRKLITSGHLLEWLAFSLPEERLQDPKFERALDYVANLLDQNHGTSWHRGGLGHALHALAIYEQRVLGATPGQRTQGMGTKTSPSQ
jgi:hypothetical protein